MDRVRPSYESVYTFRLSVPTSSVFLKTRLTHRGLVVSLLNWQLITHTDLMSGENLVSPN